MGACVSSSKNDKQIMIKDIYDQQPEDTHTFNNMSLPTLSFSAQLTKLKIKRCMYPSLSMKFSIAGIQEFLLPQKNVNSQVIKWQVDHVFRFQLNEYEMRKKFLIIIFIDKNGIQVGQLKLNLYLLATGPFHQDFALKLANDPTSRLSFNLKISQIIKMKFQFLQAQMIPYQKQYPGDKFAFSVRSIMGHNTQYTNQSYVVNLAFDQQQQKDKNNNKTIENIKAQNINGSLQLRKNKSRKSIVSNLHQSQIQVDRSNIKWSKQVSNNMPSFSTQIALFDMNSSAFHIIYWKIDENNIQKNHQQNVKAQCFVSINKLLNFQSKIVYNQNNIPYDQRIIKLQQKNWSHGKQVGLSEFKIKFSIQKHIKQMQVCVRTQLGILKSSPVFSRQGTKTVNRQINQLMELSTKIDTEFIQLAKNRKNNGSALQNRRSIDAIMKYLNQQKQILKKTVKQSIMFFNYKDQTQLLKGQQQIIQIAFKTKFYINQNIDQISSVCYSLLFVILKRGQFNLAYIGFNTQTVGTGNNIETNPFYKKKIRIALKYQQLLSQLMSLTLSSLNFKGHESQKQFAQLFCAVAYFRIPSFRKHVLQAIYRPDDPQIQQWRGTQFNLYEQGQNNNTITTNQEKNTYEILFDWQNGLYKFIQNDQNYKKNISELETILLNNQWQDRIKQRKGAFYSFVRYWGDYVQSIAVNSKNLKWKHFPGYNKILHAFLVQMKHKQLNDYSDRMQKACVSLLNNQRLLNTFVAILFKKADINNPPSILKLLDYLQLFFATLNNKKRIIPTTFDYNYFFKGFKMIMQSSHCYSMGKALILIYNHFNILSPDFKYSVSLYLMGKLFFRLFLHWSQNVRTIFQHLLYVRINKLTEYSKNTKNMNFTRNQRAQLRNRYDKLMIILENANQLKKKIQKSQTIRYEKQYYKKMKKKLYNKKYGQKIAVLSNDQTSQVSMRQLSYNPRKNSIKDEKLIQQLAKPKLQRYNSQIMSRNLKIAIQQAQNKKDQIIPLSSNTRQSTYQNDFLPLRKQSIDNKQIKKINLLTEQQGQIWQMTKKQTQYLSKSLAEYSGIHQQFLKHLAKNSNPDAVPVVKLEIAYDYDDIRPEGIDQW